MKEKGQNIKIKAPLWFEENFEVLLGHHLGIFASASRHERNLDFHILCGNILCWRGHSWYNERPFFDENYVSNGSSLLGFSMQLFRIYRDKNLNLQFKTSFDNIVRCQLKQSLFHPQIIFDWEDLWSNFHLKWKHDYFSYLLFLAGGHEKVFR